MAIGRSFQRTNIFAKLSVFENVRLAAQSRTRGSFEMWQTAEALPAVNARGRSAR
jgi:branched-chain amino acid transport system ATP-binding protein